MNVPTVRSSSSAATAVAVPGRTPTSVRIRRRRVDIANSAEPILTAACDASAVDAAAASPGAEQVV